MYVTKKYTFIFLFCSNAVRYAFGPVLQKQLDEFTLEWNHHKIRLNHMAELPSGVPDVLYNFPCIHGKL